MIGDDVYIMQSVHIPHDAHLYNKVVVTPMTVLAGLAKVLEGANLAIGCAINQRTTIGQYSIAAAGAVVMKNIKPFSRYIPGKPISINKYAIEKYGYNDYLDEIEAYVFDDVLPTSSTVLDIVNVFKSWVEKYGLETYE
jgi:UDP-N-acetylglucosamine acyltransferase